MVELRMLPGHLVAQLAHGLDRPGRCHLRAMRAQPGIHLLLHAIDDRLDRPQGVIEIKRDGADVHAGGNDSIGFSGVLRILVARGFFRFSAIDFGTCALR